MNNNQATKDTTPLPSGGAGGGFEGSGSVVPSHYLIPFILVTLCFALWGFANDITNPMVKAFSKIFRMSVTEGALVQVAFYGGYFCMAFPAAIFIRKFSYKSGVLMGLGLYATGALLFFPAKMVGIYGCFLIAYFIMTCGLSFLETSCNPYILTMGSEETSTRRLNMAQCFNPCGSIIGMYVAMNFIQARLNPMSSSERANLSPEQFDAMKEADLSVLISPYLAIGLVIVAMFIVIMLVKMPKNGDQNRDIHFMPTLSPSSSTSAPRSCAGPSSSSTARASSWPKAWASRPPKCSPSASTSPPCCSSSAPVSWPPTS